MLPIQRSMKAFARGARMGVRMIRIASERKTSSKAAVNLLSRSWIRNRIGSDRSMNVSMMLRACWVAHPLVGLAGSARVSVYLTGSSDGVVTIAA